MKTLIPIAFVLLVLGACAPLQPANPPASMPSTVNGVRFSVQREPSGEMLLMLDNGSRDPIGYNLCTSVLTRRSGSEWTQVSNDICTMQLMTLNPGADATFRKNPGNLSAGEYRYVVRVESPLGGSQVTLATETFVVR